MINRFDKCLSMEYRTVENDASFATERIGSVLYIYFQHSQGLKDWINNFDFPAKPYRNMGDMWFCHRGFLKVWKSIEPYIADEINDPGVKNIEIVGYSHGAAIATLCYEYVKYNRPDVYVFGIGFGGPRVLWGFACKRVLDRFEGFYMIRNCKDIVTHVPPAIFGFRHVGTTIQIGKNSKGLIDDHRPENYAANMDF